MSDIPLHLQRRIEQRWAARFVRPVASAAPKTIDLKCAVDSLPRPEKAKETNDNQLAWPFIPFPEGWYGA
jgi:hypothetical protein